MSITIAELSVMATVATALAAWYTIVRDHFRKR